MLNCRRKAELNGGDFKVGSGPNITERKGEIGYNHSFESILYLVWMGIGKPLESLPNVWEFKGELRRKENRLTVSKEDRKIKEKKKRTRIEDRRRTY